MIHCMKETVSIKKITWFRPTGKSRSLRNKKFISGAIIALVLILSPFLFYLYRYAPDAKTWNLGLFTIHSGGFPNVYSLAHALFTKLLFLIVFTLWYFTCNHWWKYAIMVPFTMVAFQISGVINYQIQLIDEYDFWYSLPIVLPLVALLFFIGKKLDYLTTGIDLKEEIEEEIKKIQNS